MQIEKLIMKIEEVLMKYLLLSLSMLVFGSLAVGQSQSPPSGEEEHQKEYNKRVTKDSLFGVYIPKDVPDAFKQLDKLIDEASKRKFKKYSEDSVKVFGVKSLGKWMTINWSLYEGSRLVANLRGRGLYHPQDMALFLVIGYYRKLNNLPMEEEKRISEYQKARHDAFIAEKKKGKVLSETVTKKPKPAK